MHPPTPRFNISPGQIQKSPSSILIVVLGRLLLLGVHRKMEHANKKLTLNTHIYHFYIYICTHTPHICISNYSLFHANLDSPALFLQFSLNLLMIKGIQVKLTANQSEPKRAANLARYLQRSFRHREGGYLDHHPSGCKWLITSNHLITRWWLNQPIWKICSKLYHFPRERGKHEKMLKPL